MRLIYMGTPDFAVPALKQLIEDGHDIVAVYTQPPRPKGRGHKVQKSPVHLCAEEHGLPVFTPQTLKTIEDQEKIAAHNADLAVVAAYGLILPQAVLDAPEKGCINIHASLLPRWRGASPIQHAIWKGDEQTGVTLMQMEAGLDTGPMLMKESIPIDQDMTAQTLHDRLARMGADMVSRLLPDLDTLSPEAQDNSVSNYAPLLTKDHGKIDWSQTATEIHRQIRALNPWPGTWTQSQSGQVFKILSAKIINAAHQKTPGYFTDLSRGLIACGQNTLLELKDIKPPGKSAMSWTDAMNGRHFDPSTFFVS